jgi:hypothetical protein
MIVTMVVVLYSTVSSGINALSANTVEDLLERPLKNLKDATVTVIAKLLGKFNIVLHVKMNNEQ